MKTSEDEGRVRRFRTLNEARTHNVRGARHAPRATLPGGARERD